MPRRRRKELMARADEIDQPLPAIPAVNPPGPCELSFVKDAATQLALNIDSIRLYLKACEREWGVLATSLRNAAKAYEEVDEGSADAINSAMPGSGGPRLPRADVTRHLPCRGRMTSGLRHLHHRRHRPSSTRTTRSGRRQRTSKRATTARLSGPSPGTGTRSNSPCRGRPTVSGRSTTGTALHGLPSRRTSTSSGSG